MTFSWNLITDLRVMWQWAFMRNAFEAGTVIALLAGVMGYFVVLRRASFAAHALGHIGFTGAAGAVLFGVNPIFGLLLFTTGGGTGIALLGRRASTQDIEVGTVLAFVLGLALVFLTLYNGDATLAFQLLFGQILGISSTGVLLTIVAAIGLFAALILLYRPLLFASLDEDVAEAKGLSLVGLNLAFMILLAVATSFAVQVVGILLIFALIVTPAATAVRITRNPFLGIVVSTAIALLAIWIGLFVAWFVPFPPSFFIVTTAFVIYVTVRSGQALIGRLVDPPMTRLRRTDVVNSTPSASAPHRHTP